MKNLPSEVCRLSLLVVCMTLVSCKETQMMQAQLDELNVKIKALQTEMVEMDAQMVNFRKQMPAAVSSGQVANQQAAQLAAGVAAVENEIAKTQAAVTQLEAAVATAKKELETLRAKDSR